MLRLKELRKTNGIPQKTVADKLNITRAAYTNIENGKREASYESLLTLAKFFNVSVDYLLGSDPPPRSIALEDFLEYEGLSEKSKQDLTEYLHILKLKDQKEKNMLALEDDGLRSG